MHFLAPTLANLSVANNNNSVVPKLRHCFTPLHHRKVGIMPLSYIDYAQGEVKGLPARYLMKSKFRKHRSGEELFRFTLVSNKGVEQEVEFVDEGSGHGTLGGGWYTSLVICPVETLDTREGLRIIRIDVDPSGRATYI